MGRKGIDPENGETRRRGLSWRRRILFCLIVLVPAFFLFDATFSWLLNVAGLVPKRAQMIDELLPDGPIASFDAATGYRLSRHKSRWAVVSPDGFVQSQSARGGNNLGFPDDQDFTPQRPPGVTKRLAVLGDSMSAAQFIKRNWPAETERLLNEQGQKTQLLNFSVDGGGICNWYGAVADILDRENYDIDGVVFAVCCDDLFRGLYVVHDAFEAGKHRIRVARIPGLNPDKNPKSLAECEQYFSPLMEMSGLTPREFDDLLAGNYVPPDDMKSMIVTKMMLVAFLLRHYFPQGTFTEPDAFNPELEALIGRFAEIISRRRWKAMVAWVPMQNEHPPPAMHHGASAACAAFARRLGAPLVDGSEAFRDLSGDEIKACFFEHEAHWNQRGSDRFAAYMAQKLKAWP